MWFKKSTKTESAVWDPTLFAVLKRIEARLDKLEVRVRDAGVARNAEIQVPANPKPEGNLDTRAWLQVVDRMQEIVLVAQGAQDLAQQFGLTTRQKANEPEAETRWEEPREVEGAVYG